MAVSFQPGYREARSHRASGRRAGRRLPSVRLSRSRREHGLTGWVLNDDDGVHVHVEGGARRARRVPRSRCSTEPPPAAEIAVVEVAPARVEGSRCLRDSRERRARRQPTVRNLAATCAVCDDCLRELLDPADRRFGYPYINCTNCGPRYSIVLALALRPAEHDDARVAAVRRVPSANTRTRGDRRFHAQPVACPVCGPGYVAARASGRQRARRSARDRVGGGVARATARSSRSRESAAIIWRATRAMRQRSTRCASGSFAKNDPFAVMARDLAGGAHRWSTSTTTPRRLLTFGRPADRSRARARPSCAGVAPDNDDLGVMLPYAPLHHLLFAAGAPAALVMTSAQSFQRADRLSRRGCARVARRHRRCVSRRRASDRAPDRRFGRARRGARAAAVLRRARGLAPRPSPRFRSRGADSRRRRGSEERDHAGRRRTSVREPAHRRSRPLATREAFEATVRDLLRHVRGGCGGRDRRARLASRNISQHAVRAELAARAARRRAAPSRARRQRARRARSVGDGRVLGVRIRRHGLRRGRHHLGRRGLSRIARGRAHARRASAARACSRRGCRGALSGTGRGGVSSRDRRRRSARAPAVRFSRALRAARRSWRARAFARSKRRRSGVCSTPSPRCADSRASRRSKDRPRCGSSISRGRARRGIPAYPFPFRDGEFDYRPLLEAVVADRRPDAAWKKSRSRFTRRCRPSCSTPRRRLIRRSSSRRAACFKTRCSSNCCMRRSANACGSTGAFRPTTAVSASGKPHSQQRRRRRPSTSSG